MRRALCLLALSLASCGQPVPKGNGAADTNFSLPDTVTPEPAAVAVGELGPNLDACAAAGTTRHVEAGGRLPVRSAPFDNAPETGAVAADGRFFVCTRSLDQKWFGIVYDESGSLAARCGVSQPIAARRAYQGPCRSGWVTSALVKLTGGEPPAAADSKALAPVR
jgi:hypothetical protein